MNVAKIPFTVVWNSRLYNAMKVLSYLISSDEVSPDCVKGLDEWFEKIVLDLFRRCSKSGYGILEAFITLLKCLFYRFMDSKFLSGSSSISGMGTPKKPSSSISPSLSLRQTSRTGLVLARNVEIIMKVVTNEISSLVTRQMALELLPLIANVCPEDVGDTFAQDCLVILLEESRFNPFEASVEGASDALDGLLDTVNETGFSFVSAFFLSAVVWHVCKPSFFSW